MMCATTAPSTASIPLPDIRIPAGPTILLHPVFCTETYRIMYRMIFVACRNATRLYFFIGRKACVTRRIS